MLEKNQKPNIPQIVVVGTGFHRQVSGQADSPLSSWSALLQKVNEKSRSKISHVSSIDSVMQWERMAIDLAYKKSIMASKAEQFLKIKVCKVLNSKSRELIQSKKYENNILCESLSNSPIHLISLNFDSLAYEQLKPECKFVVDRNNKILKKSKKESISVSKTRLLYDRFICKSTSNLSTVWHPHGHVGRPESLVLGMRDYGFLPPSYFYAFNQFKAWENEVAGNLQGNDKYRKLISELALFDEKSWSSKITHPADNWVTRFMLYPLTFIGVGLSQVEIGMRWLLVQRSRNFARMSKKGRNKNMPLVKFFGDKDPRIHGVEFKCSKTKRDYDQLWENALSH
jgi:hypothetical protein